MHIHMYSTHMCTHTYTEQAGNMKVYNSGSDREDMESTGSVSPYAWIVALEDVHVEGCVGQVLKMSKGLSPQMAHSCL